MAGNEKVMDLLRSLAAEGATVKSTNKEGSALTADALANLSQANMFEAWISWNKSF